MESVELYAMESAIANISMRIYQWVYQNYCPIILRSILSPITNPIWRIEREIQLKNNKQIEFIKSIRPDIKQKLLEIRENERQQELWEQEDAQRLKGELLIEVLNTPSEIKAWNFYTIPIHNACINRLLKNKKACKYCEDKIIEEDNVIKTD